MRCEHCGKNGATFHYRSVVNGEARETHLCADCAAELGYTTGFGGFGNGTPFGGIFSLLPNLAGGFDLFDEPMLTPAARRTLQVLPEQGEPVYEAESLLDEDEGRALRRERERNALDVRLKEALDAENYEEAAKIRDELKALDNHYNI